MGDSSVVLRSTWRDRMASRSAASLTQPPSSASKCAAQLDAVLARHVDRKTTELSPIEHAVLMIGAYELTNCLDIPYKVAINEAVELAKAFGGTDGHKYVNGVLDKVAFDLRPAEVNAARKAP